MRWRTLPVELFLLAFLAVFLVYPLVYVLPGAASEVSYRIVTGDQEKTSSQTFSASRRTQAEQRAKELRAGGQPAEVVREVQWTGFYFQQTLGFHWERVERFPYFRIAPQAPFIWECLGNSLLLGFITTLATTLLCLPLAFWFSRLQFVGRTFLSTLLLVPLILPPFVGGIGLQRLLDRFGALNLWLMQFGWLDPRTPIDWLGGGGYAGIVLMQVMHLYPILYLNLAAAWANVDPTLEDAARNLGAGEWRVFRTITFPLVLPGYFAGAAIVFVWAFTDLGTPLVFNFNAVIPVQIFDQVSDPSRTNAVAYALVVVTLLVTAALFYSTRWFVGRRAYVGAGKGAVAVVPKRAGRLTTALIYGIVLGITFFAILPDIGVVLTACAERWLLTPLPEAYTTEYLREVWSNRVSGVSIRNSLYYSACSTTLDIAFGVTLAWLIARRPSWLTSVLDGLAMLPLALPGLVLAFGYLTCYSNENFGVWSAYLDPTKNPALLLVIAYTVRRLPYMTRSALAGLQQIAPALEEAAENLGASRARVVRTITLPLLAANVVAGAILTFAFAVLEVSDSLMLAREEKYYPITRAIVGLLQRPDNGDNLASALAVVAMGLLVLSLLIASLVLGRKLGELFRA